MIQIPLTEDQFNAKAAALKAEGIAIAGTAGQVSRSGAIVNWTYDGATLTLTVLRKPIFIPMATVEAKIRGWFAA